MPTWQAPNLTERERLALTQIDAIDWETPQDWQGLIDDERRLKAKERAAKARRPKGKAADGQPNLLETKA